MFTRTRIYHVHFSHAFSTLTQFLGMQFQVQCNFILMSKMKYNFEIYPRKYCFFLGGDKKRKMIALYFCCYRSY